MKSPKNKFPFKIILSYVVLGAIAVVVSYFLYSEYRGFLDTSTSNPNEKKILEAGSLINLLYETDGFSRLALLTQEKSDFEIYLEKADLLFEKIEELEAVTPDALQKQQLDSVRELLERKNQNIEQIRVLKLARNENAPLDEILREFTLMDREIGRLTVDNFIENPGMLGRYEYNVMKRYVDYLNENSGVDSTDVKGVKLDSMLVSYRFIVSEAKKENSRLMRSLQTKENELIQNDMIISGQMQQIINAIDREVNRKNLLEKAEREASIQQTSRTLTLFGFAGLAILLLLSYITIADFFKAERLKEKLRAEKKFSDDLLKSREQLLSTVSHDLKTPLNTIVGYSELFTHTELSNKQQNYNRQIASSAHFVSKLVDDLLDFSKLEAGKLTLDAIPFSLDSLLNNSVRASKDIHAGKPVKLELYIDEALQGRIFESDPLRIQQIINNLVGNAYKFTEKGRIQITTNLLEKNDGDYLTEIAVTDTGIGISSEKQQLIFKEFTQADSDTFRKFGGSGLGLAISRKIAQLLNGSLEVESKPGEGSTFYFVVPLKLSQQSVTQSPYTSLIGKNTFTAVVIDDDPSMITLLKELFEQMNIATRGFTDFYQFSNSDPFAFDFVLTDIQMPGVNGFEVLDQLKNGVVQSYHSQPVIAMTGGREHSRRKYLDKGFSELLQKPFAKDELLAALSPLFLNKLETELLTLKKSRAKTPANDIYDLSLLQSFLDTEKGLQEVFQVFIEESAKNMLKIRKAIAKEKTETIQRTAHKMLTMCRQLNAKRVIPLLELMEFYESDGISQEELSMLYKDLEKEMTLLLDSLKKMVTT